MAIGLITAIIEDELIAEIPMLQNVSKNIYKWPCTETHIKVGFTEILYNGSEEKRQNENKIRRYTSKIQSIS